MVAQSFCPNSRFVECNFPRSFWKTWFSKAVAMACSVKWHEKFCLRLYTVVDSMIEGYRIDSLLRWILEGRLPKVNARGDEMHRLVREREREERPNHLPVKRYLRDTLLICYWRRLRMCTGIHEWVSCWQTNFKSILTQLHPSVCQLFCFICVACKIKILYIFFFAIDKFTIHCFTSILCYMSDQTLISLLVTYSTKFWIDHQWQKNK